MMPRFLLAVGRVQQLDLLQRGVWNKASLNILIEVFHNLLNYKLKFWLQPKDSDSQLKLKMAKKPHLDASALYSLDSLKKIAGL